MNINEQHSTTNSWWVIRFFLGVEQAMNNHHSLIVETYHQNPSDDRASKNTARIVNTNTDVGVSENSVALNPMVLLIIIPILNGYFIGNINPTFSDKK